MLRRRIQIAHSDNAVPVAAAIVVMYTASHLSIDRPNDIGVVIAPARQGAAGRAPGRPLRRLRTSNLGDCWCEIQEGAGEANLGSANSGTRTLTLLLRSECLRVYGCRLQQLKGEWRFCASAGSKSVGIRTISLPYCDDRRHLSLFIAGDVIVLRFFRKELQTMMRP